MSSLLERFLGGKKACKTPVDSSYEIDSDQSKLVPVVMTWLFHKKYCHYVELFQFLSSIY